MLAFGSKSIAGEAVLTITGEKKDKAFTRSQLLALPGKKSFQIDYDPAFPDRAVTYEAVPVAEVFKSIQLSEENTILFKCTDGFSAPLSKSRLLAQGKDDSRAYIAIENPKKPWPKLKDGRSIGPFYLIWIDPKKSNIGTEEWPFMLAGFEIKASVEQTFPLIVPPGGSQAAARGFKVFLKNCFACHTLNGQGASQMGPDLNLPQNPTEYLKTAALRTLIRDPQQLRKWPQSKMSGFKKEAVSDEDLENLIVYLEKMAGARPAPK